jgi:hypothetical protein
MARHGGEGAPNRRGMWFSAPGNFSPVLSENDPIHCQSMIYPTTYTLFVGCHPITHLGGPRHRTVIFQVLYVVDLKRFSGSGQRLSTLENSIES